GTPWEVVAHPAGLGLSGAGDVYGPVHYDPGQLLGRDDDAKYDPRGGNLVEVGMRAGVTQAKAAPFYRASLWAQQWWTLGARDVLTVRGQVGKVWSDTDRLPQDFGYRIGGARSVRVYKYNSIVIQRGDATYGAPAMAVASVEYIYY